MGRITEVTYETIKNLGNYENEKVSMKAIVNEGEDVQTVLNEVQLEVMQFLKLKPSAPVMSTSDIKRPGGQ